MTDDLIVKFIISEDIESQPTGVSNSNNIIINPILIMRSKFIPSSLSLAVTIVVHGIDFTQDNTVEIDLLNIEKDEIIYSTGVTTLNANEINEPDNFSFNLQLRNIPFETEGMYRVNFEINGHTYSEEFKVLKYGS